MLSFYDVVRERTFWINVDHIVSVVAVNKNDVNEGTYIDINGYPSRITVDKRVIDVVELIEKKRRQNK